MEPQDNKKLDLHKAVSAHEQAEAALADVINVSGDPRYVQMMERIQANLEQLRSDAAITQA
jgi:DUF1680 family protein